VVLSVLPVPPVEVATGPPYLALVTLPVMSLLVQHVELEELHTIVVLDFSRMVLLVLGVEPLIPKAVLPALTAQLANLLLVLVTELPPLIVTTAQAVMQLVPAVVELLPLIALAVLLIAPSQLLSQDLAPPAILLPALPVALMEPPQLVVMSLVLLDVLLLAPPAVVTLLVPVVALPMEQLVVTKYPIFL